MYKRNGIKKLGRTKSHRDSLIRNQIRSLLEKGSLKTTTPKAKVLRQEFSKFVNRVNSLKDKVMFSREVESLVGKGKLKLNLQKLLDSGNLGVSLVKVGFRAGDNAEVSKVQLKGLAVVKKTVAKGKSTEEDTKEKKDEKSVAKVSSKSVESNIKKEAAPKKTFTVNKERARTRSGL